MDDKSELTPKELRKLKRQITNQELAKQSRLRSAEQLDHKKPAVQDLFGKLDWDGSFDYKSERTRDCA